MAKKASKKRAKKTKKVAKTRSVAKRPVKATLIDEVRELVELMGRHELTKIDIQEGEHKVTVERGGAAAVYPPTLAPPEPAPSAPAAEREKASEPAAEEFVEVRSPMVGTFYAAPSPDSDPYTGVGDIVGNDTVVCIIEAMKVMNEIQSECAGTVAEICVKNAQPVEFGQPLFKVKPA